MTYLLAPLMSCLIATPLTPNGIDEYRECKKVEIQIDTVRHWQPLIEFYFKEEDVIQAMRIVFCESTGYASAIGNNTNGTQDKGLWQFNDKTFDWLKNKLTNMTGSWNRLDPTFSTKLASWLVYNDGWYHWNSSKHCWGADV